MMQPLFKFKSSLRCHQNIRRVIVKFKESTIDLKSTKFAKRIIGFLDILFKKNIIYSKKAK